jgi:hypothetical protein
LAGYGIARLLAAIPGVRTSWRRCIGFGFIGFLLLIALAQFVELLNEIHIEQRIGGPVINGSTTSTTIQVVGLCLASIGMIGAYKPGNSKATSAPRSGTSPAGRRP